MTKGTMDKRKRAENQRSVREERNRGEGEKEAGQDNNKLSDNG
jgi:hypothetical protein